MSAVSDRALRSPLLSLSALRARFAAALREPLLHFFVAGFLLFTLVHYQRTQHDLYSIVVTPAHVSELAARYRAEFGSSPNAATLAQLVDHDIEEEMLYREGLARNLDRDDEIVRRRVVQKMQFLTQDTTVPPARTEAQLEAWYQVHRARYAIASRVSFSHVFFADSGADTARRRASAVLTQLSDTTLRAAQRGDAFPDLYDYVNLGPEQAKRLFGESEFSRHLFDTRPGHWTGPLRSAYGWHLLRVESVQPGRIPRFSDVRDQVRADVTAADQEAANQHALAALRTRFTIVRQDRVGAR